MAYDVYFGNLDLLQLPPQFQLETSTDVACALSPRPSWCALPPGLVQYSTIGFLNGGGILPTIDPSAATDPAVARSGTQAYVYPQQTIPKTYTWSLAYQRQLSTDYLMELRYIGTPGREMPVQRRLNAGIPNPVALPIFASQQDALSQSYAGAPTLAQFLAARTRLLGAYGFDGNITMKETLARTLTHEVGKPIRQSRNELNGLDARLAFFIAESARVLRDEKVCADPAQKLEERITHEPLGVIANISAWNYPYFVGSNVFVPALVAGNAVLYKPSEFATLTGLHIAEMLHESGVPRDVFVPVVGEGATGAALLRQPIDGVFFTGSYATGAKIATGAGRRMLKVQLELGGKDPVYVCEDVDVAAAAAAVADGAFYNTGQSCCSVERVYVHASVYDAFVAAMIATSTGATLSIFFSTPTEVLEIRWEGVNATSSCPLVLSDMKGNRLFRSSTSTDMQIFEDARIFANGLVIGSSSTAASSTTMSTCLTVGQVYVWVR